MNADEYHAHPALSHSQIEDFIVSPSLYYGRHVAKNIQPSFDTDATALGTATHAVVLEGADAFETKTAIWKGGLTKKGEPTMSRNSAEYRAWKQSIGDRVEIDESDATAIAAMLDSLRLHEDAGQLLWGIEGESEKSLFWEDIHGVEARCRLDRVIPSHDVIVDLKTARDVSPKARERCMAERGYHRKADWYRRAYVANYGRPLRAFCFVWVCTSPPYDVVVSRAGSVAESLATAEIDRAIADILRRRASGDWRPPWCIDIQIDELPAWAVNRELLQEIAV